MPSSLTIRSLLLILGFLIGTLPLHAQSVDDAGQWNALLMQGNFEKIGWESSKLRWWWDNHYRLLEDADGFNQSIVRPGLGWAVTDRSTLWAGYGWIRTSPLTGNNFDEHRIWQQWTWSKGSEAWKVGLRSRFEQRFLETGDDTGLRWRQFFRVQHNLPAHPHLTLVCWDEIFYHLNDTDWGAEAGFNQNRIFAGIGIKTDPDCRWRTEIGYLNQVIEIPSGPDRNNHILSLNIFRSP